MLLHAILADPVGGIAWMQDVFTEPCRSAAQLCHTSTCLPVQAVFSSLYFGLGAGTGALAGGVLYGSVGPQVNLPCTSACLLQAKYQCSAGSSLTALCRAAQRVCELHLLAADSLRLYSWGHVHGLGSL